MLRQSCYNNDSSERVFLCGKMSQNVVRGGEKSKAVKRVMVDVISLVKNVALDVPKEF
jgi:hypothetical protein